MAAPKLKLYLLPPTYTQASDDDVQERTDDELLPVIVKQDALNSVLPMTGVGPVFGNVGYPVVWPTATSSASLSNAGSLQYIVSSGVKPTVLIPPSGFYSPYIVDGSGHTVPTTGYSIVPNSADASLFDHFQFPSQPAEPLTVHFYQRSTSSTNSRFALPYDNPYQGLNDAINRVIATPSGTGNPTYEGLPILPSLVGTNNGIILLPVPAMSVKVKYWWKTSMSQWFAGDHCNWVADHMLMWPDVFVGSEDYPGDNGTINGTPVVQGVVPEYVPNGTYSIDYRNGVVRFPQKIDSTVTPVSANYSYLAGIQNVTGQVLDSVANNYSDAGWASPTGLVVDVNLTDGNVHILSVYMRDENSNRSATVALMDPTITTVLATQTISSYGNGVYVKFYAQGHVALRIVKTAGADARINAVFLDPGSGTPNTSIGTDTTTFGNWLSTYGNDGYFYAPTAVVNPSYGTITPPPSGGFTVNLQSSDVHFPANPPVEFVVSSDSVFIASHGKPWISRNDKWLPRNVYVNGNSMGQPVTILPYDTLTVKMS